MREKVFSLKKIISLKHSGVRSCFEAFIETNTHVQSDFDFDARYWNYDPFYFKIISTDVPFLYLVDPHVHAQMGGRTTDLIYGRP